MEGRGWAWERYAWAAGLVFVIALAIETGISAGVGLDHNDSAAKIATGLDEHHKRLVVVACLSVVYAAAFPIYLTKLYDLLRGEGGRALTSLVLTGGIVFVALHAVSDIGITGFLGAKAAEFGAHDHGVSYTLYYLTFALDSVGDVFASLFAVTAGVRILESGLLPRWLGWLALAFGTLFFLQAFGLGGVIGTFGLVLDGIGFVLFVVFVLVSSIVMLRRGEAYERA